LLISPDAVINLPVDGVPDPFGDYSPSPAALQRPAGDEYQLRHFLLRDDINLIVLLGLFGI